MATHCKFKIFDQVKQPRSNRQRRERLLFWSNFPTMQEVLGGLQYDHELLPPDNKNRNVNWIAEIKGYAL